MLIGNPVVVAIVIGSINTFLWIAGALFPKFAEMMFGRVIALTIESRKSIYAAELEVLKSSHSRLLEAYKVKLNLMSGKGKMIGEYRLKTILDLRQNLFELVFEDYVNEDELYRKFKKISDKLIASQLFFDSEVVQFVKVLENTLESPLAFAETNFCNDVLGVSNKIIFSIDSMLIKIEKEELL